MSDGRIAGGSPALAAAQRQALIERVRELLRARRVVDAEQVLLSALRQNANDVEMLGLLADFYVEVQRPAEAVQLLTRCIELAPGRSRAYFALAAVLERLGRVADIVDLYTRLCSVQPDLAVAHFNRAVYLRRTDRLDEAVLAYRSAIALHIDGAADAWSNIGVILGALERHADARAAFTQALVADPRWIPALYNLALLHEEFGERDAALELFQRVLAIDPGYHDALVRIIYSVTVNDPDDPLLDRVRAALQRDDLAPAEREALLFALGKAFDDCGCYDDAFAAYAAGNNIARARTKAYDRAAAERQIEAIRASFDAAWLARVRSVSSRPLLFICGMYRSGTTLLEQMLGAHPALTPGGEIAYFNVQLERDSVGFPRLIAAADEAALHALGEGYLDYLEQRFPGAQCVINKRPDTFAYLGLLHGLFPEARFIVMRRDPLDTCLSIFFEQLGDPLGYATDLEDIAHYLRGYRELAQHWQALFPERVMAVKYEQLVGEPERALRDVCAFLELPWDAAMLRFPASGARVRTASVSQIRQRVHTRSVGRWRHYAAHLRAVANTLGEGREFDEQ